MHYSLGPCRPSIPHRHFCSAMNKSPTVTVALQRNGKKKKKMVHFRVTNLGGGGFLHIAVPDDGICDIFGCRTNRPISPSQCRCVVFLSILKGFITAT